MDESETSVVANNDSSVILNKVIRPHDSLRNIHNPRTLLVVASEGSIKIPQDLRCFTKGSNGVIVRHTSSLPLERSNKNLPIDAIALVYKLFNADSLKAIKESLLFIDVRYFVGKCFILVTADGDFCSDDLEEIEQFASRYILPVHFARKCKKDDQKQPVLQIPSNLVQMYCPPLGCDVNRLVIEAVM